MTKSLRLPNGVTVVCEERLNSGMVAMQIGIKSGSASEPDDEAGLTYLTQKSCLGGTATRSRAEIAEAIEDRGASFSSDADRTSTVFAIEGLARDAGTLFTVLADVVRHPSFEPDEIKNTQSQIAQLIDQRNQSPGKRVGNKLMEAIFGTQPAAHSSLGTKDLVTGFTPAQLRARHESLLSDPSAIVVSFAGDIDLAAAQKLADRHFGDLKPAPTKPAIPAMSFTGGDIREPTADEQLNLAFGFPAAALPSPERFDFLMLNDLLSGGMSSPLFREIREKRGLVYSVHADYMAFDTAGAFYVTAGTGGDARELISATMDLLGGVMRDGFTQNELDASRERIVRGIRGALESADASCGRNMSQIHNFGRIVPLEEIESKLAQVTSDSLRQACAAMLRSGKYALAGVGPQGMMPTENEIRAMMQAQLVHAPAISPVNRPAPALTPVFQKAQAQTVIAPQPPQTTILPNGMTVVTAERPGSLACGAWVRVGSDNETPKENGVSHMNEHMRFRRTLSYGPGEIDRKIESEMGGKLNAYTSKDRTAYYFYNLQPDHLAATVDICGEMIFKTSFDPRDYEDTPIVNPDGTAVLDGNGAPAFIKGERNAVLEEIKRANDNINSRQWDLFAKTAYPGDVHGRPILGTPASLFGMTAADLAAYSARHDVANETVFVAAGPVRHQDFVALIDKKFGSMQPVFTTPLPTPRYQGGTAAMEMKSAQLCQIIVGAEGVPETHPDAQAYEALCGILAGGASSRLHQELVDRRMLTNGIGAGSNGYRHCGSVVFATSAKAGNVKEIAVAVYRELRAIAANVTQAELDKAKANLEMGMLHRLETNQEACDAYGNDALVHGRAATPADMTAQIRAISLADIRRVAATLLASNPTTAMVVPVGTDPALLPTHADIVAMRDGTWNKPATQPKPQTLQAAP